ncbi:MAG: hypothetical protein ABIH26_00335 [Candidatus Eisenbacteria bacterium]
MSLGINTTTPDGIVLAADSRQSYRNRKNMSRIGSDSASKIFQIGERCGVVVAGLAFLPEDGVPKNISRFVDGFRKRIGKEVDKITISEIANQLGVFFEEKYAYKEKLKAIEHQVAEDLKKKECTDISMKQEGGVLRFTFKEPTGQRGEGIAQVDQLQFIVAGYSPDDSHQSYTVYVPGSVKEKRNSKVRGSEYGASWIGQTDLLTRVVLGYDPRIRNVPFVAESAQKMGGEEVTKQLRSLEYVIQWGTMTLQDAIDFSTLAIETTTAIQRFSDGIQADPGDMPGVGGPVDIAVITPEFGFQWVARKNLRVDGREIDLETLARERATARKEVDYRRSRKGSTGEAANVRAGARR